MNEEELRPRDAGLQPERTALAWHRTTFTVLIFALATLRSALVRSDIVSGLLSGTAVLLALTLMWISYRGQKTIEGNAVLSTFSSVSAKRLISMALCLVSLALALPAMISLITRGVL